MRYVAVAQWLRERVFAWSPVTITLALFLLSGCGTPEPAENANTAEVARPGEAPQVTASLPGGWGQPTSDECLAFVESYTAAIEQGDMWAVNRLIDWQEILQTATGGVSMKAEQLAEFKQGVLNSVSGPSGLSSQLITAVREGGSYDFLRLREVDGRQRALFRLLLPEGTMNYHELPLAKSPGGDIRVTDLYVYASGEPISATLRRAFLPIAAHSDRSLFQKLTGQESAFIEHIDSFRQMSEASGANEHAEVVRIYHTLPMSLQKEKNYLLVRYSAAMQLDDTEYLAALNDFRKYYPRDPCIDMLSIDYFLMQKQYDKSLACIDSLDKAVGGDPYCDVLRGNIEMQQPDLAAARKHFTAACEADPKLLGARVGLLDVNTAEGNFDEATQHLQVLVDDFHVQIENLSEMPEYAELLRSPQFKAWRTARETR